MDGFSAFIFLSIISSGILVPAIIFININKGKRNTNKTLLIIGWAMVFTLITAVSIGLGFFIIYARSSILGWLIILTPFMVIAGLIVTLALGASYLVKGLTKDENGKRNRGALITGIVMLSVSATIVLTIATLFVLFANGLIPIALM